MENPLSNTTLKKNFKLMSLNIWGGSVLEPLTHFINHHQDTDIFCFQEVYSKAKKSISHDPDDPAILNIHERLSALLPSHRPYFRPVVNGDYGICTFVHKNIQVFDEGEYSIYTTRNYEGLGPAHSRILQWLKVEIQGQEMMVINIHGLWNGRGKGDAPERIAQSNCIRSFTNTLNTPFILCGDFNLNPDTESLHILASDMQDLVSLHKVPSTRSGFYKKPNKFADYILLSKDLKATDFQVLQDQVSDHLPLVAQIELD
jgi:endonuclease/exonuclease/phosphatase family metal-dependent hydrolase